MKTIASTLATLAAFALGATTIGSFAQTTTTSSTTTKKTESTVPPVEVIVKTPAKTRTVRHKATTVKAEAPASTTTNVKTKVDPATGTTAVTTSTTNK